MITYAELEALTLSLTATNENPIRCLIALKDIERRGVDEGFEHPWMRLALQKMKHYCVGEIMDERQEMLDWVAKNFDRIQKRKQAIERDKAAGIVDLFSGS